MTVAQEPVMSGGSQLPLKQIQSAPGCTVVHDDGAGRRGRRAAAARHRESSCRADTSCRWRTSSPALAAPLGHDEGGGGAVGSYGVGGGGGGPLVASRRESASRADTSCRWRTSNPPRAARSDTTRMAALVPRIGWRWRRRLAVAATPGIGIPGGYQLPLAQVQSGPGCTVWHDDGGGVVAVAVGWRGVQRNSIDRVQAVRHQVQLTVRIDAKTRNADRPVAKFGGVFGDIRRCRRARSWRRSTARATTRGW